MKTILVIDDDKDLRQALTSALEAQGWDVISASNGDDGVELARKHLPKVILCDLLMPGKNGFRVCSTIRDDDALKYSILIAMSGKGFEDTRQAAMEAGADEFMVKPLDFARLCEILGQITKRSALESSAATTTPAAPPFVRFWGVRGSIPSPGPDTVRRVMSRRQRAARTTAKLRVQDSLSGAQHQEMRRLLVDQRGRWVAREEHGDIEAGTWR